MHQKRGHEGDTRNHDVRHRIVAWMVGISGLCALFFGVIHVSQDRLDRALASLSALLAAALLLILLRYSRSVRLTFVSATLYAAAMTLGMLVTGLFSHADFVWCLLVPLLVAYSGGVRLASWLLPLYLLAVAGIVLHPDFVGRALWHDLELTVRFLGLLALVAAIAFLYERTRASDRARLQGEVADRRAAEAELAATVRELEATGEEAARLADRAQAASEAKTRFLSHISHDIRTPLTGVIGMAEMLELTDLNETQQRYVETIHAGGEAVAELIGDVLDLAKIETGHAELVLTEIELVLFLDEVRRVLEPLATAKGLDLITKVEPGLPGRLMADPKRLRQILLNLGGNAVKFTSQGEVRITAGPGPVDEGRWWRLRVQDTGIGIHPDQHERIFESFSQADLTGGREGGSGLGLAICSRLVALMGGRLDLRSEERRGSTFWADLPIVVASGGHEPTAVQTVDPLIPRPCRILLVDDSEIVRRVVTAMLTREGHAVVEAPDGETALRRVFRGHFDVALMDVQLPGIDGPETVRRLRQGDELASPSDLPVVGITALADAETRLRCLDAGMAEVVTKPLTKGALLHALAVTVAVTVGE